MDETGTVFVLFESWQVCKQWQVTTIIFFLLLNDEDGS